MEFLLGPVLFVRDAAPANQVWGVVLCLVLIPGMLVGMLRPRDWSIALALLAALAWCFFGVIGAGIGV
jgi:hypothetical protein